MKEEFLEKAVDVSSEVETFADAEAKRLFEAGKAVTMEGKVHPNFEAKAPAEAVVVTPTFAVESEDDEELILMVTPVKVI